LFYIVYLLLTLSVFVRLRCCC